MPIHTFPVEDAWTYLDSLAGATMARFLERYVHEPIRTLLAEAPQGEAPEEMELPELVLGMSKTKFTMSVAGETLEITRSPRATADGPTDALPEDADA